MRGAPAMAWALAALAVAGCMGSGPGTPGEGGPPGDAGDGAGFDVVAATPLDPDAMPVLAAAVRWSFPLPEGSGARGAPLSSPLLVDVDGDGTLDVVQAHGEEFRSVADASVDQSTGAVVAISGADGSLLWATKLGAVDASPAWGDVTGDGSPDLVVGLRSRLSLGVLAPDNGTVMHEWPLENWVHSPALVDLDGDGVSEAVAVTGGFEGGAKGPGKPGDVVVARHGPSTDAPVRSALGQEAYASPGVAKAGEGWVALVGTGGQLTPGGSVQAWGLGGDGAPASLWREEMDTGVLSSPLLADLDGDGALEAVVLTWWGGVYARGVADGRKVWDAATATLLWTSPASAELTGDGLPDVVVTGYVTEGLHFRAFEQEINGKFSAVEGTGGIVAAWEGATGRMLWQRNLTGFTPANPVTADVTGDGHAEVLFVAVRGDRGFFGGESMLVVLDGRDGSAVGAMPLEGAVIATPAVADIDDDGRPEVAIATITGDVVLVGFEVTSEPAVPWAYPRWRGNEQGTGHVAG